MFLNLKKHGKIQGGNGLKTAKGKMILSLAVATSMIASIMIVAGNRKNKGFTLIKNEK